MPEEFLDGIDAALTGPRDRVYLFRGSRFVDTGGARARRPADRRDVGRRCATGSSTTPTTTAIDAAFVSRGGDPVRVQGRPVPALRDARRPNGRRRLPALDQGRLGRPADDVRGGAGRARSSSRAPTYLVRGERVRALLRRRPPPRRPDLPAAAGAPMGSWADYQLGDLRVISRFKQLHDRTSDADGGLAAVLSATVVTADPYARLAGLFGWNVDELGVGQAAPRVPARRAPGYEVEVDLELVVAAVDLFALVAPLGGATVDGVRRRLDAAVPPTAPTRRRRRTRRGRAADGLRRLLALRYGESGVARRSSGTLHDELNVATRDALVAAVLAQSAGPADLTRPVRPAVHRRRHGQRRAPPRGCARRSPPRSCSSTATCSTCSRSRSGRDDGVPAAAGRGQGRAAALVGVDEELPGVGGQPEGLPLPGELPAARAARHQDPRVRGPRGRPAAGRAHAGGRPSAPTAATSTSTPRCPG